MRSFADTRMPASQKATADAAAPPTAEDFYAECLRHLVRSGIPFLLAGTHAVNAYTGIDRPMKDLDIFCKAGDYPRILGYFQRHGYETAVEDERWIAKVLKGKHFLDVIFNATTSVTPVTDQWFAEAHTARPYGVEVQIVPPTELVWSKAFVQDRHRYDGADVAHVILKRHADIDWRRLLSYMEQYWEVLLIHVINFRFIYPTERDRIPRWLLDELSARLREHADIPIPDTKICRGRLYSRSDYEIDIVDWGFADLIGAPRTE